MWLFNALEPVLSALGAAAALGCGVRMLWVQWGTKGPLASGAGEADRAAGVASRPAEAVGRPAERVLVSLMAFALFALLTAEVVKAVDLRRTVAPAPGPPQVAGPAAVKPEPKAPVAVPFGDGSGVLERFIKLVEDEKEAVLVDSSRWQFLRGSADLLYLAMRGWRRDQESVVGIKGDIVVNRNLEDYFKSFSNAVSPVDRKQINGLLIAGKAILADPRSQDWIKEVMR
jgi:hypothetical protein